MNIRPLDDRVVVKPLEAEDVTSGGIVLPDTAKERPQEGRIESVGPGRLDDQGKRVSPLVKKGDRVLFGKYSGVEVKVEGEELKILRESELLARLEG